MTTANYLTGFSISFTIIYFQIGIIFQLKIHYQLATYDGLLLKEHVPKSQEVSAKNVTVWSIMIKGH